ncbi:S-layer homology domain-containing protein, partial [Bifidobacterium boum]|uniref:S-layer homology domain-containing protein n=1 Tax=Bifidobacterium boum TaxID=78343 RepID=UPI001F1B48F4
GSYSFRGMDPVRRQDMAAFLRREATLMGVPGAASWKPSDKDWKRFRDVSRDTPHAEDVLWLAHANVSTGYADGTFGGMLPVYRQDMAAFLHRLDGLKK